MKMECSKQYSRDAHADETWADIKKGSLARASGFSFPTILQICEAACMRIILAKWLSDENIIVIATQAVRETCTP